MSGDNPFGIATCLGRTGTDPFIEMPVEVAKNLGGRRLQLADATEADHYRPDGDPAAGERRRQPRDTTAGYRTGDVAPPPEPVPRPNRGE